MIDRLRIAEHEAAHAVMASRLDVPVRRVTLTADGGVTEMEPMSHDDPGAGRRALLVALAGDAWTARR